MANTIKILNSGVSSATPNSLEYGEIAINYNDGKLFYKDSSNAIVGSALISDNYVATLTAGTGVTISGGTGLGSSPTISIGQAVGIADDVTFNTVTATNGLTTLTTVGQPTSTPSDGTIAVDVTNNILYFMSGGNWQPVTAGGSGASVTSTDTPPSSPSAGDLWFETDTGNLFIYYNDGSSSQWVDIGGSSVANISVSDDAPQNPVNGDIWFETDTARTFVYYNDGTTGQWVEIGATAVAAVGIDGAVQFASNSTLAATPNFVWDDSNKRLGINTSTPSYSLDVTGSARITAGVIADLTGNADTASALQTARNIELTGDVTGTAAFDGSANIQISTTVVNLTSNLNDLNDVDAASPSNGDFLRFDGSNWINDAVNLSTDTIGDYVDSLVAGTGVTITDNSGEAATPTIAIGQDVGTTADVIFNTVTADLTGNADTASALQTARTIELTGDVTGSASFDGSADITISATVTGEVTALNDLSDVTAATPSDGEFLQFNGSEWVASTYPTSEPMGHEDKTESTISFDSGSLTFSIAPVADSFTIWCKGVRHIKTTTQSVTIPNTAGLYYISFDENGAIQYELSYFEWHNDTPTAYVYWNGTDYILFDERHGITLDWQTHEYLHRTRGAVIANGFGASNYVEDGDGSSDAHAQIDIADGTFFDEDLQVDITHSATPTANTFEQILQGAAEMPVLYRSGSVWTYDTATEYPFKQGSSLPTYNLNTAGTWSTPDIGNSKFGVSWIAATNIIGSPVVVIMGQDQYNNIGEAEAAAWDSLNLTDFPVVEMRPLYKVAYQVASGFSNTPKAAIRGVYDLRRLGSGSSSIPAFPVADHGSLTGLSDDDHTIYLLADGTRTATELTISGDLTVDTDTLYVDSANNRVGIGTTTPTVALDVTGNAFISQDAEVDGILTANHIHGNIAGSVYLRVKNTSGSTIAAGTPVYATGSVGASGATEVSPSNASTSSTMPALGITQASIANNAEGHATVLGVISGLNTSAYAVNTILYVAPGGGLTSTRPTSSSDLIQAIARVVRTDSSTGELLVLGAGRTNDIPNDITLGTDTIGDYVESLVAGTGITITDNSGEAATPSIAIGQDVSTTANVTFNTVNADLTGNVTGNADTASVLQNARNIELTGDVTGSALFDGSADITISATVAADSVALGTDTTGDYVQNLVAGTGVTLADNSGESATPTISIGQNVSTTSNVTFANVNSDLVGSVTGDIYAANGTSKILENGTDGTNAAFLGNVTGTVSDISNHDLGNLGDVNFTFVAPAQGDIVYFDGSEWTNVPYNLDGSGDVVLSSIQDGQYLRYDAGSGEWQNDFIDLGTDTVGDYVQNLVAGTGITLINNSGEGATPSISIGQDVATTANVTFNDLIITGDLTVQGNTTSLETATLQVEDNIVVLNYGQASPVLDAGIQVNRGSGTDVTLRWNESLDYWDFTNDGTTYYKLITQLDDVSDVDLSSNAPVSGDLLKFDGSNWVPDALNLGADTTGDYVQNLVAGTGVTITNNSGESATPNIAIGQDVATTADVTFNTVTGTNGVVTLTSTGTPSASLADGAIAIDTANNILYFRSGSAWQQVSGGVEIGDAPPSSANEGDLWWESDTGRLKVYYNDGTSTQWVDAFTSGAGTSSSGSSSLLWTQFYYDGGVGPSGSTTGTLGENHGTWYEATAANYANTGLGSNNSADDPTLTGITYNSGTGRFTGFSQGVYQVSFTGNAAIDAAGLTIPQQKGIDISGNGIIVDFPINILPEAAYHSYPNFEAGFSLSTTVVMYDSNTANNYMEVSAGTQNTWYYAYYGYLSITKIG